MGLLCSQRHWLPVVPRVIAPNSSPAGWTLMEQFSAATPLDETVLLGLSAESVNPKIAQWGFPMQPTNPLEKKAG